ncbi:MAG TPA: hypothetical protein VKP30_29635 [Polyangiaceae bacterium]|nr:hypothetical protein [Polyangiaceae bacterium]
MLCTEESTPENDGVPSLGKRASSAWWIELSLSIPAFILFLIASQRLPLDVDEAYYVFGGAFLGSGQLPYRDFFFPQMPLTAIVFGIWSGVFGESFAIARCLGAILASVIGYVIVRVVRARIGTLQAIVALGYYSLSISALMWMPRMKTYALSSLLTVLALMIVTEPRVNQRLALCAGILSGLAISSRLLFVPVPLLVLLAICLRVDVPASSHRTYLARIGLGTALGLFPALVLALLSPSQFYFDNVQYHSLRDGSVGLVGDFAQKLLMLKSQFALRGALWPEGVQALIVVPSSIAAWLFVNPRARHLAIFPIAALTLLIVSLLPTPTHRQYLVTLVPFAVISIALLVVGDSRKLLAIAALLLLPYGCVCVRSMAPILMRPRDDRPANYDAVGRAVAEATRAEDTVAALRPPFLFAAGRPVEPCSYNSFARGNWSTLSPEQIQRYHLCTDTDLVHAVRSGNVAAFVTHPNGDLGLTPELVQNGWKPIERPPATIWIAPNRGRATTGASAAPIQ